MKKDKEHIQRMTGAKSFWLELLWPVLLQGISFCLPQRRKPTILQDRIGYSTQILPVQEVEGLAYLSLYAVVVKLKFSPPK